MSPNVRGRAPPIGQSRVKYGDRTVAIVKSRFSMLAAMCAAMRFVCRVFDPIPVSATFEPFRVSPMPIQKEVAMRTRTLSSLCALCVVLMSQVVFAQAEAGAKIRGDAWNGGQVQTYQRHAQDRSQMLYQYAQPQTPVTKPEAKELVTGIKKDLTEADKALAKLKADHAKEPEIVKQIALIEKHHVKAHEVCGMAEEHCLKEHGDHVVIADCCANMWNELDAAQVETNKLLKMLKIEKLPVPKKPAEKKEDKKAEK